MDGRGVVGVTLQNRLDQGHAAIRGLVVAAAEGGELGLGRDQA